MLCDICRNVLNGRSRQVGKEEIASGNSYKTAITRNKISSPAKWLIDSNLIDGEYLLDYGCGKSLDSYGAYKSNGGIVDRYDPYYAPWSKISSQYKFHTILCTYVLCTVSLKEQENIIADIKSRLYKNGKAYFSVRSDIRGKIFSSIGTMRREVKNIPEMKCIHANSRFKIFEYVKE